MTDIKLKPCPFCGREAILDGGRGVNGKDPYWYIICYGCGGSVYGDTDKVKLVERWNRRASE